MCGTDQNIADRDARFNSSGLFNLLCEWTGNAEAIYNDQTDCCAGFYAYHSGSEWVMNAGRGSAILPRAVAAHKVQARLELNGRGCDVANRSADLKVLGKTLCNVLGKTLGKTLGKALPKTMCC